MCIKKETTFKDDEIVVVVVNNNNDDQKSVSFVFGRERERVFVVAKRFVTTMKNWRQQIRLHFSNSIIYIYIQKQNERERVVCEHAHGKEESLGMPPNDDDNTTTTIASEEENEKEEARRHRA